MLRLSLLLTFIGLAVSAERPSLDRTSLLGMIRNDPNALVKIFETATADNDKVNTIIKLLKNLIDEGTAEIESIVDSIGAAKNASDRASEAYILATGKEKTLLTEYNAAKKATNAARGRLAGVKKIYDAESPALKKEIEVFRKVSGLLNSLLNGNDLVEEDSEEVKAFISIADQADPVKVQRIIDLINRLLKASTDELNSLDANVKKAEAALEACIKAENTAKGLWDAAKQDAADKKKAWDEAKGAFEVLERNGKARIQVVEGEINTLKSVITLLEQLTE